MEVWTRNGRHGGPPAGSVEVRGARAGARRRRVVARVARRSAAAVAALVLAVGVGASPASAAFTMDSGGPLSCSMINGYQFYVFTYNYAAGDEVGHMQFVGNTTYYSHDFGDNLPPATRYWTFLLKSSPLWIVMGEIQENNRSGARCMR